MNSYFQFLDTVNEHVMLRNPHLDMSAEWLNDNDGMQFQSGRAIKLQNKQG